MNSSCCRTTHPFDSIIPLPMSQSAARCQRSQASQFFNLAGRPGVISFGGGLPTAEGFPVDAIRAAANWVLEKEAERALQYSASEPVQERCFRNPSGWGRSSSLPCSYSSHSC